MKAVLTSLYSVFMPISQSRFKHHLSVYFINHCLVVLCKFLGVLGVFLSQRIGYI